MDSYSDIIQKRALAGVMILSAGKELLYVNEEARKFLRGLMGKGDLEPDPADGKDVSLPEPIPSLCDELLSAMGGEEKEEGEEKEGKKHFIYKNIVSMGEEYFLRAIPIHRISKKDGASHVMITVERFSTRLTADIGKICSRFGLTKRETEVLKGLARGMTNRDISGLLFISEHTVKDHVKSLMQKIGVNNRSLLICRIFESHR